VFTPPPTAALHPADFIALAYLGKTYVHMLRLWVWIQDAGGDASGFQSLINNGCVLTAA